MFKISTKYQKPKDEYNKYFFRLVSVNFKLDSVVKAKKHMKSIYKEICLDITGKIFELLEDEVNVQMCELFKEPEILIKIKHDKYTTLIYS